MEIEQRKDGLEANFIHEGLQIPMPWFLESHTTQSFIRIYANLIYPLLTGGIAIIDELDASIHPLFLPELVGWFYDAERNRSGAQLWMSCHSVSLMDDLVKEEIVLCEKDRRGRTQAFSLMDVRALRLRDNLYKKYLAGVYGSVSHIG